MMQHCVHDLDRCEAVHLDIDDQPAHHTGICVGVQRRWGPVDSMRHSCEQVSQTAELELRCADLWLYKMR
jgi:hypothetical protein